MGAPALRNCMKLKELGPGAASKILLCRSANDLYCGEFVKKFDRIKDFT